VKILMVTAHPEVRSFNFALRARALSVLEREGIEVKCSDLHQSGFSPSAGACDFVSFPPGEPLDLMKAQKASDSYGGFVAEIHEEQQKLLWTDGVVLQFPLWWGSYPAVLKGWVDRVLSYGFAYGRSKILPSKFVMFSVTTGGASDPAPAAAAEDRTRIAQMTEDVFGYIRWEIREPYLAHGPANATEEVRLQLLNGYEAHLKRYLVRKEDPSGSAA
jgi:NAD(P)H dehydrogenase (quinone)